MSESNTALCLQLIEHRSFNKSVILGVTVKIHLRSISCRFLLMDNPSGEHMRHS